MQIARSPQRWGFLLAVAGTLASFFSCGDSTPPDQGELTGGLSGSSTAGTGGADFSVGSFGQGAASASSGQGAGSSGDGGYGMGTFESGKAIGGAGNLAPAALAIDNQGNIVVVGTISAGSIDFGGGAQQGDSDGNVFVVKFDAAGNHIWSKTAGAAGFQGARAVAIDSQDNIAIVGTFRGQLNFGNTALDNAGTQFADIYLAKLDASGSELWAKRFGDGVANADSGEGVAIDSQDNIIITGQFQNTVTFGTEQLKAATGGDGFSLFVAKFASNGDHVFSKQFGDAGTQSGLAVATSVDGSIGLGGRTNGSVDFGGGPKPKPNGQRAFLAKLSSTGQEIFSELFTGTGDASLNAVTFNGAGDLFYCGNYKDKISIRGNDLQAASGSDEIFVGHFDANGNSIYAARFGDSGLDQARDITVDSNGFAYVVGKFGNKLRVNSMSTLEASDLFDGYILSVAPDGHGYWGASFAGDKVQEVVGIGL